jgi:hypothetical protein
MRYVLIIVMIGFIVTCALIGTADDAELSAFDPFRPATILPIVAKRAQQVPPLVRDLVDGLTAPFRQRIERTTTLPSDSR